MREFVELEPLREFLSCVDHDLGFFRMLAASHVSGELYLLLCREYVFGAAPALKIGKRSLRLVQITDKAVSFVDFARELYHQSFLLQFLDLEQFFVDWGSI